MGFDRPQEVSQLYSVIGLEQYFLSLASGAPTLADIQIVGANAKFIQFDPGVADQGTVVLDATPTSFKDLWETATGKVWDDVMAPQGPVGIVSATVGNTGAAAYTIGGKSTTDHKTFAVGTVFRCGPGYDYDLNLVALLERLNGIPVVTNATGTGAIATSYAPGAAFWLESVTLHLSAAPSTSEDLTITLNANDGAVYDTVLLTQDLSSPAATDVVFVPAEGRRLFESGDAIDVAWTNTDGRTFGLRIVARLA